MDPLLLIDTSYISFYRFHATIFWYKLSQKKKNIPETHEWFKDKIFMDKFKTMYLKGIDKINNEIKKRTGKKIPYNNFVFGLDCPTENIWRTKLFPKYKAQRDYTGWTGSPVLKFAHTILIDKLCSENGMSKISIDGLEADDVLAITKTHVRSITPNRQIFILTNDHDYLQLIDKHTTILNLQKKCLNDKSCGNPKKDLKMKILCGDPADNIKGCFKRCGKKTAMKYCENEKLLENAFLKNPESRKIFSFNEKLIDFNFIPKKLKTKALNKIKLFCQSFL